MDDSIAREGTLARCNQNREDSFDDIECANARRAAAAIALQEERARREQLERESERKLAALRDAMAAALAAAEAAYEAQWAGTEITFDENGEIVAGVPLDPAPESEPAQFGAPIPPPITESASSIPDTLLPPE